MEIHLAPRNSCGAPTVMADRMANRIERTLKNFPLLDVGKKSFFVLPFNFRPQLTRLIRYSEKILSKYHILTEDTGFNC